MHRPIFYDASGRRKRIVLPLIFLALLLICASAAAFAFTIMDVPAPPLLQLNLERPRMTPLSQQMGNIGHPIHHTSHKVMLALAGWLPRVAAPAPAHVSNMAFYVPWDDASRASLRQHIDQIDQVAPALITVIGPEHKLRVTSDAAFASLVNQGVHRPAIFPVVQNVSDTKWDGGETARLLRDGTARKAMLKQLVPLLRSMNAHGVMFDFEALPSTSQHDYLAFLKDAAAIMHPAGLKIMLTVPVDDPTWNLAAYGRIADRVVLMDYDQHYIGDKPGPIAAQPWFVARLRHAQTVIPNDKIIVAIGSYAYDWPEGQTAAALSIEDAWLTAHDSQAIIRFDAESGNSTYDYMEGNQIHHVWMLDAASAWNQIRAVRQSGVSGMALWRLGSEDPGFWTALGSKADHPPAEFGRLTSFNSVDVEGSGEILDIDDVPTIGHRSIRTENGLIVDEHYHGLPTPYVIRRTGYQPGKIALTFDDGPDPVWTPKILDILAREHVPATFFVIGENVMTHPALVERIVRQGSEIGNHSYTHPNLAEMSNAGTRMELNGTQRLIEAYTGRSIRLFRAPYFGDAEPTTADEIGPALEAQKAGYLNVGLHVDPGDWKRPGVDAIVQRTIEQVEKGTAERTGQIVLLHDSGGNRDQTVAALPRIISALRAKGYQFVPVSQLAGLSADEVMPPVKGADLTAVRIDVAMFLALAAITVALKWLFFSIILFGMARAIMLTALALGSRMKRNRAIPPAIDPELFVSVIIPAFNEAKVIEASVRRVLASESVAIEVIVVDDGSTDGTSSIVASAFAEEGRVRLLTLRNGGKAAALNQALKLAKAPIIVALDADTQFEPLTIARLARWFADPDIGAVAGNAMVGNRVNLVTRWQAVEYVTAQNLERRALARFDAITVVPGAVGAWRREALDDVGGYPLDTLAEDQDLTIAIQRNGWRVTYDTEAVAWTEAPESFGALSKQRFRWAYGTLQCLWKHRGIWREGQPKGLALVGLPQAWLFQIGFALVSPIIDLALLFNIIGTAMQVHQHGWAQTQSDVLYMGLFWLAFTTIDLLCGWIAYRLEPREKHFPGLLLVAQRFVYRQIMYSVVIRAVSSAILGPWVGWGKLERSGRVQEATPLAESATTG